MFVALGGTSWALATGSIDSREIKNNTVSTRDLRNGNVRTADIQNAGITGADLRRGAVTLARTIDAEPASPEQTILAVLDLGRLVVSDNGCDVTPQRAFNFAWRNDDNVAQDVWSHFADSDDPAIPPIYLLTDPGTAFTVSLSGADTVAATLRIRPAGSAVRAVTIELFAETAQTQNVCRVSAQALISR